MAEKVRRVRRKRRVRSLPGVETFQIFRHRISPERLAILIAVIAVGIVLAMVCFTYGSRFYSDWREKRLLKHAQALLQQADYNGAEAEAREALQFHTDSLPA